MIPAPPRAVSSSAQAWDIMRDDVTLRQSMMTPGFNDQRQRDLLALGHEDRQKGNSGYYLPARIELEIRDTNERAQALYDACCEVWEIHGLKKSRAFYRAVFDNCLQSLFGTRRAVVASELQHRDQVMRTAGRSSAAQGSLARRMDQLSATWNQRLERETRDCETRERVEREKTALVPTTQAQSDPTLTNRQVDERVTKLTDDQLRDNASTFTWKELESRFKEFQSKLTGQRFTATYIRTEWESGEVGEEWILGGTPVWRKEFENLATIAARKLGYTESTNADEYWLNRVREWMQEGSLDKDRDAAWLPSGMISRGESVGTTQDFQTERIGELSAMLCMDLIGRRCPESTVSSSSQNEPDTPQASKPSVSRPLLNKYRSAIKRAILIQLTQNPNATDLELCRGLDADGSVEMPATWNNGLPGERRFARVYADSSRRHRIEIAFSKVRADLRKQRLMD